MLTVHCGLRRINSIRRLQACDMTLGHFPCHMWPLIAFHIMQVAQRDAMQSALQANRDLQKHLKMVGEQIAQLMQDNERHIASVIQLRKSTGTHSTLLICAANSRGQGASPLNAVLQGSCMLLLHSSPMQPASHAILAVHSIWDARSLALTNTPPFDNFAL